MAKIFAGNSHPKLADNIAHYLGSSQLNSLSVRRFSDGEIWIDALEDVRGEDTFIIQPTQPPAENLLELLLIIDTLKRASAKSVTAVIPYYSYARQDRKHKSRAPISARAIAKLLEASGVDRLLTLDMHCDQLEGFFDVPVDHLRAKPILLPCLQSRQTVNLVLCAPDIGAIKTTRRYSQLLGNIPFIWMDKRRDMPNKSDVLSVNGSDVKGKDIFIIDDIIDTGGTMSNSSIILYEKGANSVKVMATHGIFSGEALHRMKEARIQEIIVTNSVPQEGKNTIVVDCAPLLGQAILRIFSQQTLRGLFI